MDLLWQSRQGTPGAVHWAPLAGPEALVSALDGRPPAAMLVLSGVTPGPDEPLELNATLARACLDAARAAGIPRVLHASSSAVYGAPRSAPFRETDPPRPGAAYGRAKLAAEAVCDAARSEGLEVCALRIGNVFGADALMRNAAHLAPGATLHIDRFEDGRGPLRSYIGPRTLARVLGVLATYPEPLPPVLNLAVPGAVAMADLAGAAQVPWRWTPAPPSAVQRVLLDCGALAGRVGFSVEEGTAEGIATQLASLPKATPLLT